MSVLLYNNYPSGYGGGGGGGWVIVYDTLIFFLLGHNKIFKDFNILKF